jgi:hypothetical protein
MKNNTTEKKKSKAPIIVAAVVGLGIIGSAGNDNDDNENTNRREERETTLITTTIVEETEWNIWEDEKTTIILDFDENSKIITLIAGEQGEYGKMITYNKGTEFEENFYAYYVPYGTYKIANVGEYRTQVNVYSDETVINENGWEEFADSVCNDVLEAGENLTAIVPENYHIEIREPALITLEKISDNTTIETTATTVEIVETAKEMTTTEDTSPTVYITPTGEKYHYDNACNGGTYKESTLNQAERLHLEPCNKCVLG